MKIRSVLACATLFCAGCEHSSGVSQPKASGSAVATLAIAPDSVYVTQGHTAQLAVIAKDGAGATLGALQASWTTDNPLIATVSATGLVTGVAHGGPVHVSATVDGKTAAATVLVTLDGSQVLGSSGGTVTATGSGASVVLSSAALSGSALVQIGDTARGASQYAAVSDIAHHIIIPLTSNTGTIGGGGSITINVPVKSASTLGSSLFLRLQFKGSSNSYWAPAVQLSPTLASVTIPAAAFADVRTVLRADTLDAVVDIEAVVTDFGTSSDKLALASKNKTQTNGYACNPAVAASNPEVYAPCGVFQLKALGTPVAPHSGAVGIVLVHGWSLSEATWTDYYLNQGISCNTQLVLATLSFETICNPGTRLAGPSLPGQTRFARLIAQLMADFPSTPLYVFNYESFNDYQAVGGALADALTKEVQGQGLAGLIVIAHSMGGLVSRQATQIVESNTGGAQTVLGLITLGTPHLGTPLPSQKIAGAFFGGIPTPGGQSLRRSLPRTEKAPLLAIAGNMNNEQLSHGLYGEPWSILCNLQSCDNDGVVSVSSAAPTTSATNGDFTTLANTAAVMIGYDHSQLVDGKESQIANDPVYKLVKTQTGLLIARRGAVRSAFSIGPADGIVGSPLAPLRVDLLDAKDKAIAASSYDVSLKLVGGAPGASLSGTLTAKTVGGRVTFSDLRIDRSASGYALIAQVPNLPDVTSGAFTIGAAASPNIKLSASSISFGAVAGGPNPNTQQVQVTNGGAGTLDGLIANTTYQPGQAAGWLSAPLSGSAAPASVSLIPSIAGLPAGTYNATISVSSGATGVTNSPQTVAVSLTVSAAATPPTIQLSPSSLTFSGTAGAANPVNQTVQVTNGGGGTLSGVSLGTITYGTGQPMGWLSPSLGSTTAPTTLTFSASLGSLAAGTYSASLPVASTANGVTNSPQSVAVIFTVSPPAATTGSLGLTLSGLPSGTSATIDVSGPNSYHTSTTLVNGASATLSSLVPGTYSVSAPTQVVALTPGSANYKAASQNVNVVAGSTSSTTVSYAIATGFLTLSVTGLPSGCLVGYGFEATGGRGGSGPIGSDPITFPLLDPGPVTVTWGAPQGPCTGSTLHPTQTTFTVTVSASVTPVSVTGAYIP